MIGMAAHDLTETVELVQRDLFGALARQRCLEVAIDQLMERFGPEVVHRANEMTKSLGISSAPVLDFLDDGKPG